MNPFTTPREWLIEFINALTPLVIEAFSVPLVGQWLGNILLNLLNFAGEVATVLYDLAKWWDTVTVALKGILSWSTIKVYIWGWLPKLEDTVSWFMDRVSWFTSQVTTWWETTISTVNDLISVEVQPFNSMLTAWTSFWNETLPQWTTTLSKVASDLSNFFTVILPTLFDIQFAEEWWKTKFTDITDAVNTAFREAEPLWKGWQDMRAQVVEFFANPLGWIQTHVIEPIIDDFNRGFDRGMKGEDK